MPVLRRRLLTHLNHGEVTRHRPELFRVLGVGNNPGDICAFGAVSQVRRAQHGGRRVEDKASLNAGEHGFPQLDLVVEHEHHAVASLDANAGQPVG